MIKLDKARLIKHIVKLTHYHKKCEQALDGTIAPELFSKYDALFCEEASKVVHILDSIDPEMGSRVEAHLQKIYTI